MYFPPKRNVVQEGFIFLNFAIEISPFFLHNNRTKKYLCSDWQFLAARNFSGKIKADFLNGLETAQHRITAALTAW